MDKFDSKVVSFQRNADYLRQRALKNRREGKNADALELMRQAALREPDNAAYAMELADMYSEMGLYEQANRRLMHALSTGEASNECLYLMANNLYSRGDVSRAERVLRAYVESGAEGSRAEEAERLLDEIAYSKDYALPRDRKLMRAARFVSRALNALRAGNPAAAETLFYRAIALRDYAPEVHSLRALSLFLLNRKDEAKDELEALEARENDEPGTRFFKARCIGAQVYNYLGEKERAEETMRALLKEDADTTESRMRVNALCEMGMHAEVCEAVQSALREEPYDKALLHISSAAAYNTGLPDDETARGWQRISRLDPDDPVCAYFLDALKNERLPERPMSYLYMFPQEEMNRHFHRIAEIAKTGPDALRDAWKNDREFRGFLEWELALGNDQLARTALTVISSIDDDEARTLLHVYAERPDVSMPIRMYAMTMMKVQSIPMEPILGEAFLTAGMPTEDEIMSELPVSEKQMIRYAAEYVEDAYGDYPVVDIALIWRAFLESRGSASDPVGRSEAGSAALAMVYLQMRGHYDDIYTVSRWYGCSPRQAAHIARRFRDGIGMSGTGE